MAFPLTTCGHTIQDDEQRGLILYGSELGHTYPEGQVRKGPGGTSGSQRSRVPTLRALITQTLSVHHGLGVASACRSWPSLLASADLCRGLEQLEAALKSAALWVEPRDRRTLQ